MPLVLEIEEGVSEILTSLRGVVSHDRCGDV